MVQTDRGGTSEWEAPPLSQQLPMKTTPYAESPTTITPNFPCVICWPVLSVNACLSVSVCVSVASSTVHKKKKQKVQSSTQSTWKYLLQLLLFLYPPSLTHHCVREPLVYMYTMVILMCCATLVIVRLSDSTTNRNASSDKFCCSFDPLHYQSI